jgi:hypothetical protein
LQKTIDEFNALYDWFNICEKREVK